MTTSPQSRGVAAVTGASGYVGSVLAAGLRRDGWSVIALGRTPPPQQVDGWRPYDLSQPPASGLLDGVGLLVHCAYDMRVRRRRDIWRINVEGSRRLLEAAAAVPRTIVISSMSAYDGSRQVYGRAKLEIEQTAAEIGATVIRPGLVWGPHAGGMIGTLRRAAQLPLVPLVAGRSPQYTIHEDDLTAVVQALATTADPPAGPLGVAFPGPLPFRDILSQLARSQGASPRLLPVSWKLLYPVLLAIDAAAPGAAPFRADSLLGLAHPAPNLPNRERLLALGVPIRAFGT